MEVPLSPFESCPTEIFLHIKDTYAPIEARAALLALRSTSRRLNAVFTPHSVCELNFSWVIEEEDEDATRLKARKLNAKPGQPFLAPAPEVFAQSITSIIVTFYPFNYFRRSTAQNALNYSNQLAPFWDEVQRYTSLRCLDFDWADTTMQINPQIAIYRHLSKTLLETVHKTTGGKLTRLHWQIPYGIQLQQHMHQTLLPTLSVEQLRLDAYEDSQIRLHPYRPTSLLGDLVTRIPALRSISLDCNTPFPVCNMEELFPAELDEVALESVSIMGLLPDSPYDPRLLLAPAPRLPNIRNLKKLDIDCGRFRPPTTLDMDLLWHALRESGARLTDLSVNYGVSNALMEYLGSYEGLISLHCGIHVPPTDNPPISETFTKRVLPRHASSINFLRFTASGYRCSNISSWKGIAFDLTTWPTPSAFQQLVLLSTVARESWEPNSQNLQRLLDYATAIPKLVQLEIECLITVLDLASFEAQMMSIGECVSIRRCKVHLIRVTTSRQAASMVASWRVEFPGIEERVTGPDEQFKLSSFELCCY